jgi:hypothetical protein
MEKISLIQSSSIEDYELLSKCHMQSSPQHYAPDWASPIPRLVIFFNAMRPSHRSDRDTLISLGSWRKVHATHDEVQDFFVFIVRDVKFHVLHKQTHVFSTPSLWSSQQRVNIALIVDGTHILINVIIVDSIYAKKKFTNHFFYEWLQGLQFKQRLCHIMIDTLRMISSL